MARSKRKEMQRLHFWRPCEKPQRHEVTRVEAPRPSDLAGTSTVARRQRLHAEALRDVVVQDQSTFAVRCGNCGSEDARGVMTQTSGPQDEGWSQMSVRGSCLHCGHVWLDGRD
eukprot:s788_g7.t1